MCTWQTAEGEAAEEEGGGRHPTRDRRRLGDMPELLTDDQIQSALSGDLAEWHQEGTSIVRSIKADTFADGIKLVAVVGAMADEMNHHPDIDIRWTTITFRLSTHSEGGLTQNDLDLAVAIDRAAAA